METTHAARRTRLILLMLLILTIACTLPGRDNQQNLPTDNQTEPLIETASQTNTVSTTYTPTSTTAPTSTPTPTATSTSAPTATIKDHYFFDNFESYANSPLSDRGNGVLSGFQDGKLVIEVPPNNNHTLITYSKYLSNVSTSADVQFDSVSSARVGLFCRQTMDDNNITSTYAFTVTKNGNYSVEVWKTGEDDEIYSIKTYDQGKTDLLETAVTPYHRLHIVCLEETFYFYINGFMVSEITIEDAVPSGFTGIITFNPLDAAENITSIWEFVAVANPLGE